MIKFVYAKKITLNDGNKIPVLGIGTWKSAPNEVGEAVRFAITEADYHHVDCASIYRNEKEIGEVFSDVIGKKVKREDLFITSKLWNTDHRAEHVEKACRQTLSDLKLDYLDLYLMHWGVAFKHGNGLDGIYQDGKIMTDTVPVQETWKAMEQLVKKGLVKSIGVANFTIPMLVDLLTYATIKPAMNQVEIHPYNTQEHLIAYCQEKEIAVTAYSPLGRAGTTGDGGKGPVLFEEPIIRKIAKKYHKTPAQVMLRWAVARGTIAIPKSITPERIRENSNIFDFDITAEDQGEIASLNKNYRFTNPVKWWGIPYFA